ncbi:MAG: DUF3185 family protein [Elusimicrobia bacterium]|jgi:hypothetical protein|nr:DUF3185 family protein [Elusimicrobiota bacterium]MBK7208444.1 DUF3185 family protein [Elusimicrobiota bacterium]MBK7545204.1 DUF3185 family protein [Elusimicrobiota bacterium]MBK7574726.1 DUF3185 family protein [Elusimicrobiota bacterium]MBK7688701.1 DUF3185 family protein [Elusimicrobiota bacterium]
MNKAVPIVLLVVGVTLIVFGVNASNSFGSDVSRLITGEPTDKALWLLVGGGVASLVGLFGVFTRSKS